MADSFTNNSTLIKKIAYIKRKYKMCKIKKNKWAFILNYGV